MTNAHVDHAAVRSAILELAISGDNDHALAVWDMYDAYQANELELVLQAGESDTVREIENLISCTIAPRPTVLEETISGDLRRCPSHFLSTADEILVRCQNGAGHADPIHAYETLDNPGYTWTAEQAFGFVDLTKPTELDRCTHCGSPESPHLCGIHVGRAAVPAQPQEWSAFTTANDGSALDATRPEPAVTTEQGTLVDSSPIAQNA